MLATLPAACSSTRPTTAAASPSAAEFPLHLTDPTLPLTTAVGLTTAGQPSVGGIQPEQNVLSMLATVSVADHLPVADRRRLVGLDELTAATRARLADLLRDVAGADNAESMALSADALLMISGQPDLGELVPAASLDELITSLGPDPESNVTALRLRSGLIVAGAHPPPATAALDARLCLAAQVTNLDYTEAVPLLAGEITSLRLPCVRDMVDRLTAQVGAASVLSPSVVSDLSLGRVPGIAGGLVDAAAAIEAAVAAGAFAPNESMRLLARVLSASTVPFTPQPATLTWLASMVSSLAGIPEVGPDDTPMEAYLYAEIDEFRARPIWSVAVDTEHILSATGHRNALDLVLTIAGTDPAAHVAPDASCDERLAAINGLELTPGVVKLSLPFRPVKLLHAVSGAHPTCAEAFAELDRDGERTVSSEWAAVYAGCAVAETQAQRDRLRDRASGAVRRSSVTWDPRTDANDAAGMFDHYSLDWLDAFAQSGSCDDLTLWKQGR